MYYVNKDLDVIVNLSDVKMACIEEALSSRSTIRFSIKIEYMNDATVVLDHLTSGEAKKYFEEISNLLLTTE